MSLPRRGSKPSELRLSSTDNRLTIRGRLERLRVACGGGRAQRGEAAAGCCRLESPRSRKLLSRGSQVRALPGVPIKCYDTTTYETKLNCARALAFRAEATGGRCRPPRVVSRLSVWAGGPSRPAPEMQRRPSRNRWLLHSRDAFLWSATPGSLGKWIGARSADAAHALSVNCQSSGFAYPSMRYTERLADAGIAPSVGAKAMPTPMPSPSRSLVSSRRR